VYKGMADIEGFSRQQIGEFSRRRRQIEAWVVAEKWQPTAAAFEAATLATRRVERDHPLDRLMPEWRERAPRWG